MWKHWKLTQYKGWAGGWSNKQSSLTLDAVFESHVKPKVNFKCLNLHFWGLIRVFFSKPNQETLKPKLNQTANLGVTEATNVTWWKCAVRLELQMANVVMLPQIPHIYSQPLYLVNINITKKCIKLQITSKKMTPNQNPYIKISFLLFSWQSSHI